MQWLGPRARWLLAALGVVLMSAACGARPAAAGSAQTSRPPATASSAQPSRSPAAATSAQPSSGTALVSGVVEASPGCPVERPGHSCQSRRLVDVQVVARPLPAGVTATTRTRADGRYSLRLQPGRYMLVAAIRQILPRCPPVLVSVTSLAPVSININCDSGIR
jgi:hypothetical protein